MCLWRDFKRLYSLEVLINVFMTFTEDQGERCTRASPPSPALNNVISVKACGMIISLSLCLGQAGHELGKYQNKELDNGSRGKFTGRPVIS
jgi:hypothetical protein